MIRRRGDQATVAMPQPRRRDGGEEQEEPERDGIPIDLARAPSICVVTRNTPLESPVFEWVWAQWIAVSDIEFNPSKGAVRDHEACTTRVNPHAKIWMQDVGDRAPKTEDSCRQDQDKQPNPDPLENAAGGVAPERNKED